MSKQNSTNQAQAAPVQTHGDFPVKWKNPDDPELFWMMDSSHYPKPITPLDFSLFMKAIYEKGPAKACKYYGYPGRLYCRYINTYIYSTSVYECDPSETDAQLKLYSEKMEPIFADIGRLWENEWLPEIKTHITYWENYDLGRASASDLLDHLNETEIRLERLWEIHSRLLQPMLLSIYYFNQMYGDLFPDTDKADAYELIGGFETEFTRSDQELWSLSRQALISPKVHKILIDVESSHVLTRLTESPEGRTFLVALNKYLDKYGKKSGIVLLSEPFCIEEPSLVIKTLQHYMTLPDHDDPAVELKKAVQQREQRYAEVREQIIGYPDPVIEKFESTLKAARTASMLMTHHTHWLDNHTSYEVRLVILEAGLRLAKAHVIQERDHVFYLKFDELKKALQMLPKAADCSKIIDERRAAEKRFVGCQPPPFLGTPPTAFPNDPVMLAFMEVTGTGEPSSENILQNEIKGKPGSGGVIQGTARVIYQLSESERLNSGEILVTEFTLPGWTPLFPRIAAVVTNSGGMLSHSAIVAREYGIPAVVGTGIATSVIQDGQTIEVDGDKGIVRIIDKEL